MSIPTDGPRMIDPDQRELEGYVDNTEALATDFEDFISKWDGESIDLARAAESRIHLLAAYQTLAFCKERLDDLIGNAMGKDRRVDIPRVGRIERHYKTSYTRWDKSDLLRAVLDTRLADPDTGELKDETPLDKVLQVWNLAAPRVTALRERGLDPDEFATVERRPGWVIRSY